ncbi:Signal transduction histidine kinase-related protein, C-terminal [Sesbania bispinosa]|nr:Signal transduction histidine kinase-related protein, C-terminal [Sesbania bispinosa]
MILPFSMALRPSSFVILLAYGALLVVASLTPCWDDANFGSTLKIQDTEYLIHCHPIDIMGIESVYVLAVPQNGFVNFDLNYYKKKALAFFIVMMVMIFIAIFSFLLINAKPQGEKCICVPHLIKQMEATQQSERKNLNKSLAFASASHDLRTSLAGLTGLLNSILDTSKLSRKMQLEEEEFECVPSPGGVVDFLPSRGQLKKGHITVRAWAQKPTLQSSIIKTNQYSFMKCLSCLLYKKNETHDDLEKAMNSIQQDPNCTDFIFEVDDTGKGIPKENYKSVFENYVQVKETALGQGGTGLGLGIVQSLVRLMHGDIGIVDKDIGKKGTCFRFNVLLTLCESETVTECSTRECLEYGSGDDRNQTRGRINIHTTSSGSSICSMSPRLHICSSSPRPEASHVVLLIGNKERRRISQRFMESLGIKVKAVKSWKHLFYTLEKFRLKGHYSGSQSSPESSNLSSQNYSFAKVRVPLSAMDGNGIEYIPPSVLKKTDIGAAPGFILIIIDVNEETFSELHRIVSKFKKSLANPCKVVWLDKSLMLSVNSETVDQDDIVISKPFHGSQLFQVIKLLPEYGGTWQTSSSKAMRGISHDRARKSSSSRDSSLSKYQSPKMILDRSQVSPSDETPCGGDSSCHKPLRGKKFWLLRISSKF